MPNRWVEPECLWEHDIEGYYNAVRVYDELERDNVKELEDLIDKQVEGKENPRFQDCLAEGHIIGKKEVRSLARVRLASCVPQSILASYEH